jgi:hypothetical protein
MKIKGNSNAAIAGRVGKIIRRANRWKVREGILTLKELRKWAKGAEARARENPESFRCWWGAYRR